MYFTGSPFDNNGAVGIRMNFDVAIYGDDEKGNGAFNQNVLNVEAVGTASADGQGNLSIDSLGSFPVSVNGVDNATTNFRLRLEAPANTPTGDSTPPSIVAQYPSACGYTYGLGHKQTYLWQGDEIDPFNAATNANGNLIPVTEPAPATASTRPDGMGDPVSRAIAWLQRQPDQDPAVDAPDTTCVDYLTAQHNGRYLVHFAADQGDSNLYVSSTGQQYAAGPLGFQDTVDGINNVLPEISPSVTFSEPVDPASLTNINGNPDAGHLQLMGPAGNIPVNLRVEGSTVVIDPNDPLDYNTEYTLTVGTGVTDLAGNALSSSREIVFHTAPYVPSTDGTAAIQSLPPFLGGDKTIYQLNNIIETAPFLTTLYPGLPCPLTGGDFKTGGGTAGYCVGSDQSSSAPMRSWDVFDLPANRAVHMVFSKPVQSDSIKLADGCLTGTNGVAAPASNGGSVAMQIMNSSGQCTGVVDAGVLLPHPGYPYTRALSIRSASPWQPDQRYWLVICGSDNTNATCVTGKTIVDVDNGKPATNFEAEFGFPTHDGRLNTDAMNGTGTNAACGFRFLDSITVNQVRFYGCPEAAGGPDIVMPFDGAPASQDQFLIAQLKPFTDVNGNGFAEGGNFTYATGGSEAASNPNDYLVNTDSVPSNTPLPWDTADSAELHLPTGDRERPTRMNRAMTTSMGAGAGTIANSVGVTLPTYNSGAQPSSVGAVRSAADCDAMMSQAVRDMVGANHGQCAPVTIYPGGVVAQTAVNAGQVATGTPYGRTLLHTRGVPDPDNPQHTVPQTGYIVDRCQGSYPLNGVVRRTIQGQLTVDNDNYKLVGGTPRDYDYGPCFVFQQKVTFTADQQLAKRDAQGNSCFFGPDCVGRIFKKLAPQAELKINLVGPVAFNRNGRLVIRATNTNTVVLPDTLNPFTNGSSVAPVLIQPGATTVQLLGPAIHGGPLEAFKTQ